MYWTNSKFADWLRGTPKLKMGTSEEWDEWATKSETAHPWRYWLAEEGLRHLQDFITWPVDKLYDVKYYINNRWITRTHALTAHPRDIKPGEWRDVGNRFLPCLFNELVDFVEVELAWHHIALDDEARKKYKAPFWSVGWFRWRTWRSRQAGLDHLDWASNLVFNENWGVEKDSPNYGNPTQQALDAKEIKELYMWWTTVYRFRPDAYDASGWTAYCEADRLANGGRLSWYSDKTPELRKMCDDAHAKIEDIEEAYKKEEEEMLVRLIKIRNSLWT